MRPNYDIGGLQQWRADAHGKRRATTSIFSDRSTHEGFAFHSGGRTELQFNVGPDLRNGDTHWRHGVAFSFKRGRSLLDPSILRPKVRRFNEWLRDFAHTLPG